MGIPAGRLDRRIRLERATMSRNGVGEKVPSWSEIAVVRAGKSYRRANEGEQAGEVSAIRVLRFEIRWSARVANLNSKDRIEYPVDSGTYFDITEVNEIGRRAGFEVFATARAD